MFHTPFTRTLPPNNKRQIHSTQKAYTATQRMAAPMLMTAPAGPAAAPKITPSIFPEPIATPAAVPTTPPSAAVIPLLSQ
jgi:hypothetical protein